MTTPNYPAPLEAAPWSAQMAAHKAALAKARLKVDLGDSLKSLERAHAAVDWDLFAAEGLATADDAAQRKADLDAERAGPVKTLLKLAGQVRSEARPLIAAFKADASLKGDAARRVSEVAAAAELYARSVEDALESACKAVEKRRLALLAEVKPGKAPAVDPKLAKLAATVRSRLITGLRAVRNPLPGQPPMKFIAGMVAGRARVVIGPNVGQTQKSQLLALLPQPDGVKWIKGNCVWEDKAVTFVCATPLSGAGKRLQRALLEQTKAKLRVRVRKPDGEAETCDGSDDPAALEALEALEAPEDDAAALKSRRVVDEATLRVRIDGLLPRIARLRDEGARREHGARVLKLRQAVEKLRALKDAAAVQAVAAMLVKVAEQQAQLDAAAAVAGAAPARKPAGQGPRPRDLSDPAFAREVMALLTPQERARIKTKADYEWAIANYDQVMAIRAQLPPVPKAQLTLPTIGSATPQVLEKQAQAREQVYADRKYLREVFAEQGRDPAEIGRLDDEQIAMLIAERKNYLRLVSSPIANDGLGDSKGPVNHFLDGVEHGLGKVGHDLGNIGLAAGAVWDIAWGKPLPDEPMWYGAAGRTRGQTPTVGGLMWEIAGNVPIIGRAQLLYGATEMVRGAWNGDWNNVAYGLGNMTGAAMFGHAMGKLPLEPGNFADTRIGRTVERGRSYLFGDSPEITRPRTNPAHRMPNDDGMHMPSEVHRGDGQYSSRTPGGLEVEIAPRVVGSTVEVHPEMARQVHAAAAVVDGVLPGGRKVATPDGRPLAVVVDPAHPVPYFDRATGTVHMPPGLDAQHPFPKTGPAADLARWAPKGGEAKPTEIVMQHELGHGAMPEIGARIEAIGKRKTTRGIMKLMGLSNSPQERLADARLAREDMLVNGLDELGADTIAVAAAKDLQAMPKSVAHGIAQVIEAKTNNPDMPLPDEFPKNPVEWMRRRDFSDGGTIPKVDEPVTPYDVFSGVRRHLGKHYGDALTGPDAPKVIGALMASNERFLQKLDAEPGLLDSDYVAANALFVALFDAEAARLGLRAQAKPR